MNRKSGDDCKVNFNPRSHEGSDDESKDIVDIVKISIRAPTRGATAMALSDKRRKYISIRAPTRGATSM